MKKLLISSLLITFHAFSEIRGLECFADYENKIWFQIDLENKEVIKPYLVENQEIEEPAENAKTETAKIDNNFFILFPLFKNY